MQCFDVRRWLPLTLIVPFCVASVVAGDAPPRFNWERFRGPNGTGTTDDKNVPLTFGADKNMIWKIELPGAGNSSPIVWGNHLFLQSAARDGKKRSLLCVDTADGKIRWQKTIAGESA